MALLHVAAVAVGLLLYVALTHSGRQRRAPSAAIGWVVSLVAFPYLALPVYLLLGTRKLAHPCEAIANEAVADEGRWLQALGHGLGLPPARHCHRIDLHADGEGALQALLVLLDGASSRIDIEIFILRDDAVGKQVAAALQRATVRGVRVRVLLDGVGTLAGHRASAALLRDAGAELRWFAPMRLRLHPQFGRGNLRNHRKLVLVDGHAMWTGGRNLAEEYFLDGATSMAWRDLSVVVEGGIVADAQTVFERDWASTFSGTSKTPSPVPAAPDAGARAQLLPSGPDRRDDTAYSLFLNAIHRADARVLLATPYFVPDAQLQTALLLACRRGVDVQLLMPARSNHRMADIARERSLRELAAAGARIHLLPGMLHAKAIIVDDALASCGSINFDGRSLFLNYELNLLFHDAGQVADLAAWFTAQRAQAAGYVARAPGWWRDIGEGLVRAVGFQL
ncbi:cardiolipin synthase [Thermomonas carbonis]|uniref:Cardiolipin synthase n=2 Tax=Thermomonas carbonis TaxID=1463158 RepID=A0A7G9SUK9_9GAMM|nr:cardiolipin synthase [Thermomonas carbonis]